MGDRQKVIDLTNALYNTLFPAVLAAFDQPETRFIGNRSGAAITLHASKRLAIGPPVAANGLTSQQLMDRGIWGLYELPNTATTKQAYNLQATILSDEQYTPEVEEQRLLDPSEPDAIKTTVTQTWQFEPL